ncbi:MAG: hypothetical protein ACYDCN_13105 [Bacteroidia bacterium]
MKEPKAKHKQRIKINPVGGSISYKEAIQFILKTLKARKIAEKTPLTQFCRDHDINYQMLLNIKNNGKGQYPAVIAKVLKSLGYKITVRKEIQYKYIINSAANKRTVVAKNPKKTKL